MRPNTQRFTEAVKRVAQKKYNSGMAGIRELEFFPSKLSKKQLADSGMALVLILLLVGVLTANDLWYKLAIPVLLLTMAVPAIFRPFAWVWYSLSNILGFVVSRILLTIIYFVLVVPVGLIRRIIGKDSLYLKTFKKDTGTVMKKRNLTFSGQDLLRPY